MRIAFLVSVVCLCGYSAGLLGKGLSFFRSVEKANLTSLVMDKSIERISYKGKHVLYPYAGKGDLLIGYEMDFSTSDLDAGVIKGLGIKINEPAVNATSGTADILYVATQGGVQTPKELRGIWSESETDTEITVEFYLGDSDVIVAFSSNEIGFIKIAGHPTIEDIIDGEITITGKRVVPVDGSPQTVAEWSTTARLDFNYLLRSDDDSAEKLAKKILTTDQKEIIAFK